MQRRAEERMPGVPLGEWMRRRAAWRGAGRRGLGLRWRYREGA
ncbi:hypothetical protein [Streptomyces sp. NPDC002769]